MNGAYFTLMQHAANKTASKQSAALTHEPRHKLVHRLQHVLAGAVGQGQQLLLYGRAKGTVVGAHISNRQQRSV